MCVCNVNESKDYVFVFYLLKFPPFNQWEFNFVTSAICGVETMSKMKSFSGIWECEANDVWTINIEIPRCLCNMSMGKMVCMAIGFSF